MIHKLTLAVLLASTMMVSCSKKEETPTKPTPPKTTEKTFWIMNGRNLSPTKVEQTNKTITCSFYDGTKLYAQWYIGFDKSIGEGSYAIGGLSVTKEAYMFMEILSPNATMADSVYDSRDDETKSLKVSYSADEKMKIEVPEIWLKNRSVVGDRMRFSGLFIEE